MKKTLEHATKPYPFHFCHQLIGEISENKAFKDKVAISSEEGNYSYPQLRQDVLRTAQCLIAKGVQPETTVALYLPPSYWYVVSLLAIWEVGAHFVSLNTAPDYGLKTVESIIAEVIPPLIICANNPFSAEQRVLLLSEVQKSSPVQSLSEQRKAKPHDLAYIAFTSGSTGEPKGIEIEHIGLYNCMQGYIERLNIDQTHQLSWFASVSFDAHIMEILISLLAKATLHIVPTRTKRNLDELYAFYNEHQITTTIFTPSLLSVLKPDLIPTVHTITSTGEKLEIEVLKKWIGLNLYDGYGPAEGTVATSIGRVISTENTHCGPALPGVTINILKKDDQKRWQQCEPCEENELFISGSGVGRGYYKNPKLTAKRFLSISIEGQDEALRVYRTKDLGYLDEKDNCFITGRKGRQLKIHSQLYHPAPTEAALMKQDLVPMEQVYVDAKLNKKKYPLITVYCKASNEIVDYLAAISSLHHYLLTQLPAFHMPTLWAFVDSFPRTANMKVDAKQLIAQNVEKRHLAHRLRPEPADENEKQVSEIFHSIIDESVHLGCEDSITHVATSIQIFACVNLINDRFPAINLKVSDFYLAPTIAAVARRLRGVPNPLIQLSHQYPIQASHRPVLFLIHAVLGDALQDYEEFAKHWKGEMPIMGIKAPGLNVESMMPCTMTELVKIYVEHIKKIQPKGPYFIAGRSAGGLIGHAIVRQLMPEKALLFAFDTDIKAFTPQRFSNYLYQLISTYLVPEVEPFSDKLGSFVEEEQVVRVFEELLKKCHDNSPMHKRLITVRNIILACISYKITQFIPDMMLYTAGVTVKEHGGDQRIGWPQGQPINNYYYAKETHDSLLSHLPVIEDCSKQTTHFLRYFENAKKNLALARLHIGYPTMTQSQPGYEVLRLVFPYLEGRAFSAACMVASSWYRVGREYKSGEYVVPTVLVEKTHLSLRHCLTTLLSNLGKKRVLLVDGPSGIGKSSMLSFVEDRLHSLGYSVLRRDLCDYNVENIHQSLREEIGRWLAVSSTAHRFIILDAEDELGQLNFNHRLPNLYEKLKLDSYPNITLIISCRTEVFTALYRHDFIPHNDPGALEEWKVMPLTEQQASLLMLKFKTELSSLMSFYNDLPDFIRQNTLLLKYSLELSDELRRESFNLLRLYDLLNSKYLEKWQSTKSGFEGVPDALADDCVQLAGEIALAMIGLEQGTLPVGIDGDDLSSGLLSTKKIKLLKHIQIEKSDKAYKFSHPSFGGYFAAKLMAKLIRGPRSPEALLSDFHRFRITSKKLISNMHFVNFWKLLCDQALKQNLVDLVLCSRDRPDLAILSGIAMTLCNAAKIPLAPCDFSRTIIQDAILDYGNYQGCRFFGAKWINVSVVGAIFDSDSFERLVCENVRFNNGFVLFQERYIKFKDRNAVLSYSLRCDKTITLILKITDLNTLNTNTRTVALLSDLSNTLSWDIIRDGILSPDGKYFVLIIDSDISDEILGLCFDIGSGKIIKIINKSKCPQYTYFFYSCSSIYFLREKSSGLFEVVIESLLDNCEVNTLAIPKDHSEYFILNEDNILLTLNFTMDAPTLSAQLKAVNIYEITGELKVVDNFELNLMCKIDCLLFCRYLPKEGLLAIVANAQGANNQIADTVLNIYDVMTKCLIYSTAINSNVYRREYAIAFGAVVLINPQGYILVEEIRSKRRIYQQLSIDSKITKFDLTHEPLGILYESVDESNTTITTFKPITDANLTLANTLQPGFVRDYLLRTVDHYLQDSTQNPALLSICDFFQSTPNGPCEDYFNLLWQFRNLSMHHSPSDPNARTKLNSIQLQLRRKQRKLLESLGRSHQSETDDELSAMTILREHYQNLISHCIALALPLIPNFSINTHYHPALLQKVGIKIFDYLQGLEIVVSRNKVLAKNKFSKVVWELERTMNPEKAWIQKEFLCVISAEKNPELFVEKTTLRLIGFAYRRLSNNQFEVHEVELPDKVSLLGYENTRDRELAARVNSFLVGIKKVGDIKEEMENGPDFVWCDRAVEYNAALNAHYLAIQRQNIITIYQAKESFEICSTNRLHPDNPIRSLFIHSSLGILYIVCDNFFFEWNFSHSKATLRVLASIPLGETIQSAHIQDTTILILTKMANHYLFKKMPSEDFQLVQRSSNLPSFHEVRLDACQGIAPEVLFFLQSKGALGLPSARELDPFAQNSEMLRLDKIQSGAIMTTTLAQHNLSMITLLQLSNTSLHFPDLLDILQATQSALLTHLKQLMVDCNDIHCGIIELETIIIPLIQKSRIILCDLSMNYIAEGQLLKNKILPTAEDNKSCSALLNNPHTFLSSMGSSATSIINTSQKISPTKWLVQLAVNEDLCILGVEGVRASGQRFIRAHEFRLTKTNLMTLFVTELEPCEWREKGALMKVSECSVNIPHQKIESLLQYFTDEASAVITGTMEWTQSDWQLSLVKWLNQLLSQNSVHLEQADLSHWLNEVKKQGSNCCIF